MLAHLRTEAYPVYGTPRYPPSRRTAERAAQLSYERNLELIEAAKRCANPTLSSGFSQKEAAGEGMDSGSTADCQSLPPEGRHDAREGRVAPHAGQERCEQAAPEKK